MIPPSDKSFRPWKTRSRRLVYDRRPYLALESHTVELPDGQVIEDWPWVITREYINVVALTTGGEFLVFRQTKYAAQGVTLALVGGYIEAGENPLEAAQRELLEETGYAAPTWIPLGSFTVDGNYGNGRGHFFLALDAVQTAEIHADDLEEQELLRLNRAELEAALDAGKFQVLAWTAALALALRRLPV